MHRNSRDRAIRDPTFQIPFDGCEGLEKRDTVCRADVLEPAHGPAARVEAAIFREDTHAIDFSVGDPVQDDHPVGAFELHDARSRRRPGP